MKIEKKITPFLNVQIMNQIMSIDNFIALCESAAKNDDGVIDEMESDIIKKVTKVSNKYKSELEKILD